ncbi:hypothetical protein P5G63_03305 [Aeromonas salmonicida]|uniref:hypothetical protein n=1 Tax=Aeromonas salmonicida TaxID=645 RepID=UPI00223F0D8B|nr:hypothetical protein [Aeromonas salmonicida]MDF8327570.1 hypothetical protein [Aeromonas salmonicida]
MKRGGLHINTVLECVFSKMPIISRICAEDPAFSARKTGDENQEGERLPDDL